jgi:hypothetical protein
MFCDLAMSSSPRPAADSQAVRATFGVILAAILGSAFYSAWTTRGLYLDGTFVLYRIAESEWFFLPAPARTTVDLIRQAPIVLLTKYTDLSLVHRGQIFSFLMSAVPALLILACRFVARRKLTAGNAWFGTATCLSGRS